MSALRRVSRYAAIAAGGLIAILSAPTAPAFAQYRGGPPTITHINLNLRMTQFNFGLRYRCDRDDRSEIAGCSNNLFPVALGGPDTKVANKGFRAGVKTVQSQKKNQ